MKECCVHSMSELEEPLSVRLCIHDQFLLIDSIQRVFFGQRSQTVLKKEDKNAK